MEPIHNLQLQNYLKTINRSDTHQEKLSSRHQDSRYSKYKDCLYVLSEQPSRSLWALEDVLEFYNISEITELDLQWFRAFVASQTHAATVLDYYSMPTELVYDWLIHGGFDIEYWYETPTVYPIDHPQRNEMWQDILDAKIELEWVDWTSKTINQ